MYIRSALPVLAGLSELLSKVLVDSGIPGMSVAVMHKGEIIFAEGFGKRNANGDPFTAETLMPIASVTKSFTATAIGEMVAEGKLDWDTTPVSKYLPEFELKDPLLTSQFTFIDLLSHRTGLPSIDTAWFRTKESRRDLIKRLRYLDLNKPLKPVDQYSNVMLAVAGEAAANVEGEPYEELVTTKVLQPLGLTNSGFSVMNMRKRSNYAMPFMALSFEKAKQGELIEGYLDEIYMADAPAGDMFSNVLDLVRWGKTIMNNGMIDGKQVLNKESVEETLTAHWLVERRGRGPEFAPALCYGLGWMLDSYKGQVVYQHSGSINGYHSNLAMFPDADLVVAHLVNMDVSSVQSYSYFHIADLVLDLPKTQNWLPDKSIEEDKKTYEEQAKSANGLFPPPMENKPCSRDLKDFVGEYSSEAFGDVSVRIEKEKDEGDVLYFNMRTFDSKAEHHHFDTFRVFLEDFSFRTRTLLTFETGSDGKVKSLRLEMPEDQETFMTFEKKED